MALWSKDPASGFGRLARTSIRRALYNDTVTGCGRRPRLSDAGRWASHCSSYLCLLQTGRSDFRLFLLVRSTLALATQCGLTVRAERLR